MNDAEYTQQRAERLYAAVQQHRIGSRFTIGETGYTLVAILLGTDGIRPQYLADDWESDTQFAWLIQAEMDEEDAEPAPDDPAIAKRARAHAVSQREYVTHHGHHDILWDNPASADDIMRILQFGEADRAWRIAENAQRKAAQARAIAIARTAWTTGTQTSAGRLLGLDQSRVSRAVDTANALTGGSTT